MAFFPFLFVLEGLGMMALAMPFIKRRIGPNRMSGFRIPETLRDEATWYRVNEACGRAMLVVGAVFALFALGLYLVPGIHSAHGASIVDALVIYNCLCTAALFVGLFAIVAVGHRSIRSAK